MEENTWRVSLSKGPKGWGVRDSAPSSGDSGQRGRWWWWKAPPSSRRWKESGSPGLALSGVSWPTWQRWVKAGGDTSDNLAWGSLRKVPKAKDDVIILNVQGDKKPQETHHPPNRATCYTKAHPHSKRRQWGQVNHQGQREPMTLEVRRPEFWF